ncbi:MAG: MBL fold metallo-hydrolase [Ornithinimicrobium sp.]
MRVGTWATDDTGVLLATDAVQVRQISVSTMDNNVYLVTCVETGAQMLIDAADEASRIGDLVANSGDGTVETVVTTHRHWDHHRALTDVVAATGAKTAAGSDDADDVPVSPDRRLDQGDTITVGALALRVISLRGHTPGSIALALDVTPNSGPGEGNTERAECGTVLFTGDSLFPGGPGKTDGRSAFSSLMDDLTERIFGEYGDGAVVLPGHGDGTTLGAERGQLAQWRQRGW